jgi:hypothetical protein
MVSKDVNEENKLYRVTGKLSNRDVDLTPGQSVSIKIPLRTIENTVEIPLKYIHREQNESQLVLFNPESETIHLRSFEPIDHRQKSVLVKMDWPKHWKLLPGGIYSGLSEYSR